MQHVELDFETRSLCDLQLCGAAKYSQDPSTEIICLAYGDQVWCPGDDVIPFSEIVSRVLRFEVRFKAHNASFEQAIWKNIMVPLYGWPELPPECWDCSMAACAWKGIALSLDKGSRMLHVTEQKDAEGNKLTLSLSKPDKKTGLLPVITPDIEKRVIAYCKQDVVTEHAVVERVGTLSEHERKIWLYDQAINQRGVRLDMELVQAMQRIIDRASGPLLEEFRDLTDIEKLGSPKLKEWCAEHGVPVENLQKGYLAQLLGSEEDDPNPTAGYESLAAGDEFSGPALRVPDTVRRVLEIRQMLGGAAVKKVKRMQSCVCDDGRARGLLQYHAAHSGRWGGRLLQPQNFPRKSAGPDPDAVVSAILSGDPAIVERELGMPALVAVARSLRHALVPDPGKVFLVGDYKSIEAVIVMALAGHQQEAEDLANGEPLYMRMAEQIYNKHPGTWTNPLYYKEYKEHTYVQEYTVGKAAILGSGYQMGWETFQRRLKADNNIEISDTDAQKAINTYRERLYKVKQLWYDMQEVALDGLTGEGSGCLEVCGGRGSLQWVRLGDWHTCLLPNGWQRLWYPQPGMGIGRFGNECWRYSKWGNKGLQRVDMYGGLEVENVDQALARGVLCGAIDRLERAGLPVVLTTHDEAVVECCEDRADMLQFQNLMETGSRWVDDLGLPIKADCWMGKRYKK